MMGRRFAGTATAVAVSAFALMAATTVGPASAGTPTRTAALAQSLAVRLAAQEGLAIALASNVLQTQLLALSNAEFGTKHCQPLSGGGSSKLLSETQNGSTISAMNGIYYDNACATPYLIQKVVVTNGSNATSMTGTAVYTSSAGRTLGSLKTAASATQDGNLVDLAGLGTFSTAGRKLASLGLTCQVPNDQSSDTIFPCAGGVAQDFKTLKHSLGSVTPLTLDVRVKNGNPGKLTFSGSKNTREIGALGALSVGLKNQNKTLTLNGKHSTVNSVTTKGQAGGFVLFPPTPTGWTITDAKSHLTFSINVVSNTKRNLRGYVKTTKGKTLASIAVDRSGTGTIHYGKQKYAVISWLLTG